MGIRQEQKEKRRNEILFAALQLFTRNGYAATKVSDIALQAGMSTGLMFHYFESKEKLYEELIRIGVTGPMNMMNIPSERPIDFFEEAASQVLAFLKNEPFTANLFVLMGQAFYNNAAPQTVKELLADFDIHTPTVRLIEKGQADGTIREGDPLALAIAFWCSIQGIAEEIAVNPGCPIPESGWIVDIIRKREDSE